MAARGGYKIKGKTDYCLFCGEGFEIEPYFSKNFHKNCYQSNYGKLKRDAEKEKESKERDIKEYNLKNTITPISYEKRIHTRPITPRQVEEQIKIENKDLLVSLKETIKRKSGWIDWWEAYILCHIFEIYYPNATTYLDSFSVENQLILMWDWLKDYEYKQKKKRLI